MTVTLVTFSKKFCIYRQYNDIQSWNAVNVLNTNFLLASVAVLTTIFELGVI